MADDVSASGVVAIDYAKEQEVVFVELRKQFGGRYVDMFPAKVLEVPNGYEIITLGGFGHGFRLSKESYGFSWRCWEIRKPSVLDRERIPWD